MVREHNESRDAYSQFREMIQSAEETFPKTRPTPSEVKTEDKMDLQDSEEQPKEDEHVKSNDQHVSENSTNDAEPITQPAEVPSVSAAPVENAPVTNVENGPIVATLPSNNLAEAPAPAVDNEPTSQAQQETLSETKTSDAMEEDKPEEKQQSEKQTTDAMEDDDIDDELLASVRKAKTEQTDDSSTPKRKRGRPKKGTGPSESTPRMIPSPPQPSPRRTPIPPRYAHEEEFKVSTEPVNRVSSDFAAIQSFDDEESILKQILIAESRTDIPDGQIELRCLADYKSILDRKQRAKEKEEKKRTPKKMKKAEEEEEDFSNGLHQLAEDFIQKSLGDPSSTYQLRKYRDGTYINCDLRYFNLSSLGKFDMVLIDPPWRIGGGQRHGEQSAVFSNCNFKLQYNTMSNEEIMDLDVESLSDQGFCFLWVLNSTLQFGLDLLNKWGYTFVEKIVWVKKSRHHDTMVNVTHGYYLLHSTEMVLIGMKSFSMNKKKGLTSAGQPPPKEGDMTQRLQYISKVSNDLLFGKVSKQSQKPDQLYQVIESMMPGARKVELFARNNNIREGWLSLGNRLGHTFDTFDQDWQWTYSCNECQVDLSPIPFQRMNVERGYVRKDTKAAARSHKRFKSKIEPGIDLCENCVTHDQHGPIENYFEIENLCEEPIYHDVCHFTFTNNNSGITAIIVINVLFAESVLAVQIVKIMIFVKLVSIRSS
jgi:N6-adenosine-specific RNA methylase IME4